MTGLMIRPQQSNLPALPVDPTDLTLDALQVGGLEFLTPDSIGLPPRLAICQPVSPIVTGDGVEVPLGSIVNMLTGEVWQSVEFVVISFAPNQRAQWPRPYSSDNMAACSSSDGVNPDGGTQPQRGPCATCSLAQFGPDGAAPLCSLSRNFIVYMLGDQSAAWLRLSGTAVKIARQLTQLVMQGGLRYTVRMTTTRNKSPKGSWFSPVFARGVAVPPQYAPALATALRDVQTINDMIKRGGVTVQDEPEATGVIIDDEPLF